MEPLSQTGVSGESVLRQEEAVVASIRSAMKELQTSVQELCKASLAKIVTLGQPSSSSSSPSPLLSSLLNFVLSLQWIKTRWLHHPVVQQQTLRQLIIILRPMHKTQVQTLKTIQCFDSCQTCFSQHIHLLLQSMKWQQTLHLCLLHALKVSYWVHITACQQPVKQKLTVLEMKMYKCNTHFLFFPRAQFFIQISSLTSCMRSR